MHVVQQTSGVMSQVRVHILSSARAPFAARNLLKTEMPGESDSGKWKTESRKRKAEGGRVNKRMFSYFGRRKVALDINRDRLENALHIF